MSEKPDRRGCPPGAGTALGKPLHPGANPGRIGNPPYVKTPEIAEMVTSLARALVSQHLIAAKAGISESTLKHHYIDEYSLGRADTLIQLASMTVKAALSDDPVPGDPQQRLRILLSNMWNKRRLEHTGADGGPIEVDLTRLSDAQLEDYGRLAAIAEGLDPDTIIITPIPGRG